jgi:hypothetical protein
VAYSDFLLGEANAAAAVLERCYLRSTSGLQGSDTNPVTGWTDETGNANATLATASVPTYEDDPGDGNGPVALYSDDNGMLAGVGGGSAYLGGTAWCFWRAFQLDDLDGFQNIVSDDGGNGFDIYVNGSTWTLVDGGTTETFGTASIGVDYRIIVHRDATSYRINLNGSLVHTSTLTPSETPIFVTSAFGGSSAPMSGTEYCWGIYGEAKDADTATIDAAIVEEIDGASSDVNATGAPVLPAITASGVADVDVAASGAATLPAITASGVADVDVAAAGAATVPAVVGQGTATVSTPASYTGAATLPAITGTGELGLGLTDAFDGDRDLVGWATVNPSAIPAANTSVANDRLLIEVDDNTGDITLWFDGAAGQLKYRLTGWPFRLVIRNMGVGVDAANTQTALTVSGNDPYNFFFIQVNDDPDNPEQDYFHIAVGLRGASGFSGTERCVETKTNNSGSSTVANSGLNSLTGTRADIEIIGTAGKSITCSYSEPAAESWNSLTVPGTLPTFGDTVAFGFGAYALGNDNVPFVATADSIELNGVAIVGAITLPAVTGAGVADVDVAAQGSASLHAITASGQAGAEVAAAGASVLPAIVAAGAAAVEVDGVGAASLPAITGAGVADVDVGASGSPQLPTVTGAGTGTVGDTAYLSGAATLTAVTASGAGNVDVAATGSATLPALTAAGVADVDVVGQGAGVLPAVVGAGTLTGPITTPTTSGRITVTAGPDARLTATATAAARITVEVTAA